ncbi:MAG: ABC transporter permease [Bacteroidetes bacterium]|nr:ABC transporter permease [Bacteroidota bacterium]
MPKIKNIRQILLDETRVVLSDHSIILTVLIAPLLYAFFLGSIYINKDIDQIRFAVVDYDNSKTTRELTRMLSASPKIDVAGYLEDYKDGVEKLNNLEIEGFVIFTTGFEKQLMRMEGAEVNLYLNTTRFLPSNDLNMAVSKVMLTAGAGVRLNYFQAQGMGTQYAMQRINPVNAEVKPIYNNINSYGNFLLPGLFFLILQQTLLLGLGESIGRDYEKGHLMARLSEGKHGVVNYIFGKTAYYACLYLAYLVLFFMVIFPYFDLPVLGDIVPIMIISATFLLTIMTYSMLIGTFVKKQIRMMELLAFTTYPFFLLSGYSWPIEAMPVPLQWLAATVPTTPMLEAMTRLFVMGGHWDAVLHVFQHLVILLAVSFATLVWRLFYLRKINAIRVNPVESKGKLMA